MQVEFSKALMDAKHFPPTTIKAQPALSLNSIGLMSQQLPVEQVSTFSRARYALSFAATRLALPGKINTVLLPSYHCPALVEPFIHAGYQIKFYPQHADLSSDIAVFQQLLNTGVTHVVVVRFFGFSQNTEQLIQLAFAAGKVIIEDNAHSMQHFWQSCRLNRPQISASVSSICKTLGTADGGVLYLRDHKPHCQQPGLITELKAALSGMRPVQHARVASFRYFQPAMHNQDCLRVSRWLMMHSDYDAISKKRRQNYQYLADNLQRSSAGKVLYPTLDPHDVPYVMPFLLNDVIGFSKLREQAIQVLRWEELALPISQQTGGLRENLVQLPMHQNIPIEQLEKIITVLR